VFDQRSEIRDLAMRNDYQRLTTEISGTDIVNSVNARKTGRYYTEFRDQYVVRSGNLSEFMVDGMADLFASPLIYWRHPDLGFVQIKNTSPDTFARPRTTDRIFQVEFTFEIDHDNTRQRA
jgi:hypothetical protein